MPPVRRLTAILAADVAGYSRLMGADEEGTHHRLKAHLRELVNPKVSEHRGSIVKNTGDGFPSSRAWSMRFVALPRSSAEWSSAALSRQLYRARIKSQGSHESCRGDRISPLCSRFGSEDPQRRSGDEMALNIEGIVNCTVHAEKPLGGSS
jgi:class 3 adenylate cyclase